METGFRTTTKAMTDMEKTTKKNDGSNIAGTKTKLDNNKEAEELYKEGI